MAPEKKLSVAEPHGVEDPIPAQPRSFMDVVRESRLVTYSGVFHGCDPGVLKRLISRGIATSFVYS
jgi:hypothetical protein